MKIDWKNISLEDLAGFVAEELRKRGITTILVGGACATMNLSQKVPADAPHNLIATLVRPLVGYIISNITFLAVSLALYEVHRQSHTVHLTLTFGIGSYIHIVDISHMI